MVLKCINNILDCKVIVLLKTLNDSTETQTQRKFNEDIVKHKIVSKRWCHDQGGVKVTYQSTGQLI